MDELTVTKTPLEQSLEDDIQALEGMENDDTEQAPDDTEKVVDKAVEEAQAEPDAEEEEAPEEKEEEEDSEPPKDNQGWSDMRREKDALQKEKQELAERVARLEGAMSAGQNPQGEVAPVDAEPDRDLNPDEWTQWKIEKLEEREQQNQNTLETMRHQEAANQQYAAARAELTAVESKFAEGNKAYPEAKEFLRNSYIQELKIQAPNASDLDIRNHLDQKEIQYAAQVAYAGGDPADTFLQIAKARGFNENLTKATPKNSADSLQKLKSNKRKSASLNGASATSATAEPSSQDLVDMTLMEMSKYTTEQQDAIELRERQDM